MSIGSEQSKTVQEVEERMQRVCIYQRKEKGVEASGIRGSSGVKEDRVTFLDNWSITNLALYGVSISTGW